MACFGRRFVQTHTVCSQGRHSRSDVTHPRSDLTPYRATAKGKCMGGQLHGIFPKSVLLRFVFCLKIRALLGKLFPRVCRGTSHGTVKQRTVATEKARHRWSWGLRMYGCVARGGGSPSRGRKSRRKRLKISGHLGGGGGEMSNEQNQEPEAIGARRGLKQQSRGCGCMDASREALDHLCVAESRGAGVGGCAGRESRAIWAWAGGRRDVGG